MSMEIFLKKIKYIFFIIFIACSATVINQEKEAEEEKTDLVASFNLDMDHFAKFKSQVTAESDVEKKQEKQEKKEKQEKQEEKKLPKDKNSKSVGSESKNQKDQDVQKKMESEQILDEQSYPSDYPEVLKEYNKKYADIWLQYKPVFFPREEFHLLIQYVGITAGYATLTTIGQVNVGDQLTWHVKARLQSAAYYKYIYTLDDFIESFIDTETYLPLKFQLIQRESAQDVDDLQLFDHGQNKTFYFYKRIKKGKVKKQESSVYIPQYFQDSFSALYFARGMPLNKGVVYEFPIVTRGKIWILKFEVIDDSEIINVGDEKIEAIKIKAETHFPGVLSKRGDILFWLSKDETRKILKFTAKVKIGSISGHLIKYSIPSIP